MEKTIKNLGLAALLAVGGIGCSEKIQEAPKRNWETKFEVYGREYTLTDLDGDGKFDVMKITDSYVPINGERQADKYIIKKGYVRGNIGGSITRLEVSIVQPEFFDNLFKPRKNDVLESYRNF